MNWQHLRAVFWLRWRLSRNQLVRAGSLGKVLAAIILGVHVFLACGAAVGGLVAGFFAGKAASAETLLFVCDGGVAMFLSIWLAGFMIDVQRSESIDIAKLMHLPVTLRQIFLFNYAASHLSPGFLFFAPLLGAFCIGLTISVGWRMVLLGLTATAFLFAVTAWTYCLRGWLAGLMSNRRRAGMIAMWFTLGMVVIAQSPNLFLQSSLWKNKSRDRSETARQERTSRLIKAHLLVPPGWIGYSAMALKKGSATPAVASALVLGLLAAGGVLRGEKLTRRFYSGDSARSGKPDLKSPGVAAGNYPSALLVERRIPWLPEDVAGLALTTFRCLSRAPEVRMALLIPLLVFGIVGFQSFSNMRKTVPQFAGPFVVVICLLMIFFAVGSTMSNVFGLDRGGFRALVLSPMDRARMLLAKNLAFLPIVLGLGLVFLVTIGSLIRPGLALLLTAILQVLTGFVLFSCTSNYLSVLAPYRYSMNAVKAKSFRMATFLSALASMILTPLIGCILCIPVLLQLGWNLIRLPGWMPINVLSALALLAASLWLYFLLLPHQGRLLQRRELTILGHVTTDTE